MAKQYRVGGTSLAALSGLLLASCDLVPETYEARVTRGQSVFIQECSSCHGPAGGGTDYGEDLRSKLMNGYGYKKFSSIVMSGRTRITKEGVRRDMPSFANRPLVVENLEEIFFFLSEQAWPPERH